MRVLVTGALGFVGLHLAVALREVCGPDVELVGTAKEAGRHPVFGPVAAMDVTDYAMVEATISRHAPTHVVHLAAIAAPAAAESDPDAAWTVHVQGTLNVARAVLAVQPGSLLVHVGSGLVYGDSARRGEPLDEAALLAPVDEYAVTKAAADLAVGALVRKGLRCVRVRPFNHTGPGQASTFVVPAFARQIACIEANRQAPVIRVGNLDAERDFLDVRDVARAYALVVHQGERLQPGAVYNISSGVPRRIGDILDHLLTLSHVAIRVEHDPSRHRAGDVPRMVGNAGCARETLDWAPRHLFNDTLADVLADCRARVRAAHGNEC